MTRMASTSKSKELKSIAEEASFQLACSMEFTRWMVSLSKAIQLDLEHEDGRNIQGLADLSQYLAEVHLGDVERACKAIDLSLNQSGGDQ
ncbi:MULTISPECIES: hypothetical protein [Pseudomonas syringae group]|uniref:Uncharacterized protein n=2 Tax=Pseudomonas syringae group TaxID=136849 RepID=A0A0P9KPD6_PSECA|nr:MULTISPECIES: hypothetical protein [Pseudomonas syringae group]EGH20557.1 hypothetical protein PSYMO_03273 [Pseudomonas amygdali pv. mori str. 301020]KAA8699643.1 hypothetical protein F4W70_26535 [Pseudomonas cannabina]KPW64744.1 Uncharacterized protein ALO81_02728 [Pseudomonas cannabina]RMN32687.1 hypothetical protein ALQ64_03722 [Pseudomonas cannabina]UPT36220.1 hypothetical protein LT107_23035 [Pseudomonas amygdali pv. loropetali]